MKAGFSKINITPLKPIELWGFAKREGKSKGSLNELYAKVLTLKSDNVQLMLISLDIGGINKSVSDNIKTEITNRCFIARDNIIISTTHTHSAPAVLPLRNAGLPDDHYLNDLKRNILKTAIQSIENLQEIRIGYGQGELHWGVNRREKGIKSDIDQEEGTIDPDVSIIRIETLDNSPLVLLVNYAAHPVTLYADNLYISSDYPGEAYKVVEDHLQSEMMFLQGCSADVNPKIFGSFEATKTIGISLGNEVCRVSSEIQCQQIKIMNFYSKVISLPLANSPEVDELNKLISSYQAKQRVSLNLWEKIELQWAEDLIKYRIEHKDLTPKEIELPIQALRLNNIFILFLPGEIFVETGLKIKQLFTKKKMMITAYSNDCSYGYLPASVAYSQGAYEVEYAYKYYGLFGFARMAEEVLINEITEIMHRLSS